MLEDILRMPGTTAIRRASDSKKAKEALKEGDIDVVITERELEPESGIQLVDHIRHSSESLDRLMPVIMLTARSESEYVTESLAKPFTVDSLYRRLASVIARPRAFVNSPNISAPTGAAGRWPMTVRTGAPDDRRR